MSVFILRRVVQAIFVAFAMTLIVFFGVHVIGDPLEVMVSPDCTQACREAAAQALGLDRPIWTQYGIFLLNLAKGDLGHSFMQGEPVIRLILQRMPATLELAFSAMFIAVTFGILLGLYSGLRPNSLLGRLIMAGSILGFSLPTFWVGIMMIIVFSVELGWLPATGRGETVEILGVPLSLFTLDGLSHLILPAINLALFKMSLVIRLVRAGVREVLPADYVKFARAKGLSEARIIFVHVLKNTMIPVITVLGLEFGSVIAFSVVTESIFAWPGMGKLIIESIQNLDRPVVLGYLLITVMIFVVINLIVDILYCVFDPRIRYSSQAA